MRTLLLKGLTANCNLFIALLSFLFLHDRKDSVQIYAKPVLYILIRLQLHQTNNTAIQCPSLL